MWCSYRKLIGEDIKQENKTLIVFIFQNISNENARKELGDVDSLTEEKVDKVAEGFLEDVKENLIETNSWPVNFSAYLVSKALLNVVHAHFLTNNLNGPPIKYLGLIDYLINQPNKPSPLKHPKQTPISYLGLF
jgi:hypothetical protein